MATEQVQNRRSSVKLTRDDQKPFEPATRIAKKSIELEACGPLGKKDGLGRSARNIARGESPQPKWFTSMMDKMYGSMDVIGRQIEDLLSLVEGSEVWHRLRKEVADSYARIGREAVEKRNGPSQGSLARVDTNVKELQGTVALTARDIFQERKKKGTVNDKSEEELTKDVGDFVDGVVHEFIRLRRSILDSTREHVLAGSVQPSSLEDCVQGLVPAVEHVHSNDIRDEIGFYRILKDTPPDFVLDSQTDLCVCGSFAELAEKTKKLKQEKTCEPPANFKTDDQEPSEHAKPSKKWEEPEEEEEVEPVQEKDTLSSMNDLTIVLQEQGKWQEAEQLHRRMLETRKKILGPDHPDTLGSMSNLATVLLEQGKLQESEDLHRHVLEARKQILGPDHPDTLGSMSNLATVLLEQGKLQESKDLHRHVLETRRRILGPYHPDTLGSMSNLATVLLEQGKWQESEDLHRHVLETRKEILGPDHSDTLGSMSNLAVLMLQGGREDGQFRVEQQLKDASFQQKRVEEGLKLIRTALQRSEGRMASHHSDQLLWRRDAAMLLAQFGQGDDDLELAALELTYLLPNLLGSFKPSSGMNRSKSCEAVQTLISLSDELGHSEAAELLRQLVGEIRGPAAETEASTAAGSEGSLPAEDVSSPSEASTEETIRSLQEIMRLKMKSEEEAAKMKKEVEVHAKGLLPKLCSSHDGSSSQMSDLRRESNLPASFCMEQKSYSQVSQNQSEFVRRDEVFLESSEAKNSEDVSLAKKSAAPRNKRGLGRSARNTARGESPQPQWFTSMMDKMYASMDVKGREIEDLLSLVQGSEVLWHRLRKEVADSYARIGREAVEKRNGSSQGSLARVDTNVKELQGTVALTARNILEEGMEKVRAREKSEVDVSKDVGDFVDGVVDEFTRLRRRIFVCKPSPIRSTHELGAAADDVFKALARYPECLRAEDMTAEIISRLAKANADMNFADEPGRTALHHWAAVMDKELVTALVENEARLDQCDLEGKTPFDLATSAGAPEELLKVLDYVQLLFGLGGKQLALSTSVLEDYADLRHFLRQFVRRKWSQEWGKRVSYFSICLTIGDQIVGRATSWQSLGKPKVLVVTRSGNFREDLKQTQKFLKVAGEKGESADFDLRGHLENFQDPDARDQRGESASYKAARNDDVTKLELLYLACANLGTRDQHAKDIKNDSAASDNGADTKDHNGADNGGATPLFIASQGGCMAAVKFLVDHQAEIDLPLNTKATPLYVASQNGHQAVVDLLLASRADPNSPTEDLATPVFIAAQMGHPGVVYALIQAKSDIEFANRTQATPLFIASQNDHGEIVKCLLGQRACVNKTTTGGASPLYIAAQKGSMSALPLLIDTPGIEVDLAANDGATPILIAAQNGHLEAVTFLIKSKVDVCKAMKSGATAVFVAAQNGKRDVVQTLVDADKSLANKCLLNGTSPFYVAAQNGHMDVLQYLQEVNADVEKKSCGGATPFFISCQNGHLDIVTFLLEIERNTSRPRGEGQLVEVTNDGSSPLVVASQNGHVGVVELLTREMVEAKIPEEKRIQFINLKKQGGASALYLACQNGKTDVVEHLIAVRASIHQTLDTKETPLYIACQGGHEAIARLLIQEKADVNLGKHDGTTPVYIACQNEHTSVFRLLLNARADPDVQNVNGATPLFISSQKGFHVIVTELLEAGVNPRLSIQSGACALYIAAMKGQLEVCRVLLQCDRVDVNQTPGHGTTPLHIALRNGHVEVAKLILPRADVNKADKQGMTPLYTAIKAELWLFVEELLHCGAFVDGGLFDSGMKILRAAADQVVTQTSTSTDGGYPDAAQARSVQQFQLLKKTHEEEAKTLLHELHRLDQGILNEALSPEGLKQDLSKVLQMGAGRPSQSEDVSDVLGLVYNHIQQSVSALEPMDVSDADKVRETMQKTRTTLVSASACLRIALKLADFLQSPGCGTLESRKERGQRMLTNYEYEEVQKLFNSGGGLVASSATLVS